MVAIAQVLPDYDFKKILVLAGAPDGCEPVLSGTSLTVAGISQEALDAALAVYDHDETVAAAEREAWKTTRIKAVEGIQVTTKSGNTFDGDEISQGRMARAILGLQAAGEGSTTSWVLADNKVVQVGASELLEALTMAGVEQTRLWVGGQ